jgi:UDP-N-acetylglucosamine diphosphorylase/glucosamine-1-phosphate N-acetyltransferase
MHIYDDLAVIILAAGKGTRMKSDIAKVLHKVSGKSMITRVVECAAKVCGTEIIVVVGHQAQQVKDEVNGFLKVDYAFQEKLLGTGDAVKSAIPSLSDDIKDVMVLCGDVPLIQEETLRDLVADHKKNNAMVSVLATDVENPHGYGRIVFDGQKNLHCIREEADANEMEKKIKKVNTGIYCFNKNFLVDAVNQIKPDNSQAEYYLTDIVEIAKKRNKEIIVSNMDDSTQVIGVNTLEQLDEAQYLIQRAANELP